MGSARPDALPKGVHIFDPATGVSYSLNPFDHTARKFDEHSSIPAPPRQTTAASANSMPIPPARPRPTIEDLGTHMVEGLKVSRRRITTTIAARAEGNDRPIQVTRESWYWPELRLTMMDITNDPRKGVSVMQVNKLVRDEPPAELFRVPPDYTIEELQTVAKPAAEATGAPSTDFSGFWIQDHPDERLHPMRLHIVRNASTLTVWISYTEKFGGPGYTATINQGEAMWKEPQGCVERFRQPGYNYDNPGFNTFRLSLQGAALEYEQETQRLVPCDGHPVGVEKVTKELWRTREQLTRLE